MDNQLVITAPIQRELNDFIEMFNQALTNPDGLLGQALSHIRNRGGKRMRPILVLLMAKNYGVVNEATLHSAVGLELLHTASLVHDDVVDEAQERRGQQSVNACYDNKVAVLVGDYVLSTALYHVSMTHQEAIFRQIAELGRALANGEILQLTNTDENGLSEESLRIRLVLCSSRAVSSVLFPQVLLCMILRKLDDLVVLSVPSSRSVMISLIITTPKRLVSLRVMIWLKVSSRFLFFMR